jgi:tetratricopeptide (TPR) repeat protein
MLAPVAALLLLTVATPFPERAEDSRYLELERLYHEDKPEEGITQTRALLAQHPEEPELYVLLARFLYERGERHARDSDFPKEPLYKEMVDLLNKARALRPGDARIGWGLGVAKARLGTTRGVLSQLFMAKEIETLWLEAAEKGTKYRSLGGEEELPCDAYLTLGIFYRLIPDWWIVGLIAGTRGDLDKAVHWLEKADTCSPNKLRVLKEVGIGQLCYAERKDDPAMLARGRRTLEKALKQPAPQHSDRIDQLHVRRMLKHPDRACAYSRDGQQELDEKELPAPRR